MSANTPSEQPRTQLVNRNASPVEHVGEQAESPEEYEDEDEDEEADEEYEVLSRLITDIENHIKKLPPPNRGIQELQDYYLKNPDGSIPPFEEQIARLIEAHQAREEISTSLLTRVAARLGYDRELLEVFNESSRTMDAHFDAIRKENLRVRMLVQERSSMFMAAQRQHALRMMEVQRRRNEVHEATQEQHAQQIREIQAALHAQQAQQAHLTQQAAHALETIQAEQAQHAQQVKQAQQALQELQAEQIHQALHARHAQRQIQQQMVQQQMVQQQQPQYLVQPLQALHLHQPPQPPLSPGQQLPLQSPLPPGQQFPPHPAYHHSPAPAPPYHTRGPSFDKDQGL